MIVLRRGSVVYIPFNIALVVSFKSLILVCIFSFLNTCNHILKKHSLSVCYMPAMSKVVRNTKNKDIVFAFKEHYITVLQLQYDKLNERGSAWYLSREKGNRPRLCG